MRIAILTVSDRSASGARTDRGGPAVAEAVQKRGWDVAAREIVPDDRPAIESALRRLSDEADIILTTGGTGLAARDVTPEATMSVASRRVPGLAEAMRAASLRATPHAMLSRAEAAVRGRCLIINLPGSPKGAVECLEAVAPALDHAVRLLKGEAPDG